MKNKYAYRLEGYQEEWIETDADNRIATYTNLNPGKYVFRVKGSNNDGIWNEEGASIQHHYPSSLLEDNTGIYCLCRSFPVASQRIYFLAN